MLNYQPRGQEFIRSQNRTQDLNDKEDTKEDDIRYSGLCELNTVGIK